MDIEYIVLSTTGKCNLDCCFCFRIEENSNFMRIDDFSKLIDIFKFLGAKYINFTGGEPLLNPDLSEILKLSKASGFINVLSTNGMLLKSIKDPILDNISYLCLPLDGYTSITNDSIRINGHFTKIIDLLNQYNFDSNCSFELKINTVVCSRNIQEIQKIPNLININKKIYWKLFQMSSRGVANKSYGCDYITDKIFTETIIKLKNDNPKLLINYLSSNHNENYFFVTSDSEFILQQDDKYIKIDNVDGIYRFLDKLPFKDNSFNKITLGYDVK